MNKKVLMIAVAVIVAIVVILGGFLLLSSGKSSLKKEVVSQENYEKILDEVEKKFGESDETYYFTYACIYHTAKAGFTDEYLQSKDESMLYKEISGKTVQQLIDEGKQLMEENNVTIEEYKEKLNELGGALAK